MFLEAGTVVVLRAGARVPEGLFAADGAPLMRAAARVRGYDDPVPADARCLLLVNPTAGQLVAVAVAAAAAARRARVLVLVETEIRGEAFRIVNGV
ncbi:hypothetical protein [Equine parapoxvirus]|nr:hypothetical protein [Equine parapoxvirus]